MYVHITEYMFGYVSVCVYKKLQQHQHQNDKKTRDKLTHTPIITHAHMYT